MRRSFRLVLAGTLLLFAIDGASAETTTHKHAKHTRRYNTVQMAREANERPPLTVNRRSFLDPGPVVPVGSLNNYVTANTIFNRTPDQSFQRSRFGNENIPAPLEVPGRDAYVLRFASPAEIGEAPTIDEPNGWDWDWDKEDKE